MCGVAWQNILYDSSRFGNAWVFDAKGDKVDDDRGVIIDAV